MCVCKCVAGAVTPPSTEQDTVSAGGNAHPGMERVLVRRWSACVCESASGRTRGADPPAGVWLLLRIHGRTGV